MSDLIDPSHQARDVRLVRAAVRKGWNIPDEVMDELPALIWGIAKDVAESSKDRIAAAKLLDTMKDRNEKQGPRKKKPAPQPAPQPTVVFMDGNFDDVKRQIAARLAPLCVDNGGAGGDQSSTGGTGIEPTSGG